MSSELPKSRSAITGRRVWYRDVYEEQKSYVAVSSAKTRMLLDHPFWGFMGLDLVLVEMPHEAIPTLATDGYHIFYSAKFINSLRPGEVEFAIAHEIYHCIYGHTGGANLVNRGGRYLINGKPNPNFNAKLWNYATDYVINNDLKKTGVGEFITTIKIFYDPKYDGMSSEEVYADLLKNPPETDMEPLDIHIEFDMSDAEGGDGGSQDGDEKDGDQDGDGSGSGKDGEEKDGSGGSGNIKIKMTAKELDEEQARWIETAERAIAHVENDSDAAGSIPAHLQRLIGEINEPKIDWRTALRSFVVAIRSTGYSFTRPDKRTFGSGITLPGYRRQDQKLEIAVAIDTSGSICNEALRKFVSELLGILKSYKSYEIHAFCFEGTVNEGTYQCITGTSRTAEADLNEYAEKITGGGGTMFQSVWNFMKSKRIKPRGLVMFTDGYPCDDEWHAERNYCPAMFVTVDNHNGWKAPFGMTVAYEDH